MRVTVVVVALAAACTQPGAASSRVNTLCDLFESSDYVGRFELVSKQNTRDEYGQTPTTLRIIAPIASRAPDERSDREVATAPIQSLRMASVGSEVSASLSLADEAPGVGSQVIVFLTYSSLFARWSDFNGQGVFFDRDGGWANGFFYAQTPVPEVELLAMAARDGGCERGRTSERPDGGP